ncbi:MAG: glycosyl transferase, partial [Candidatus Tagabacteria bacterium CG09_land_8_20_14_0_10_41_14]
MKKLSIIIPVFNEKGTVREIIKRAISAPALDYQKEIIVVDDGSSDGTEKILE